MVKLNNHMFKDSKHHKISLLLFKGIAEDFLLPGGSPILLVLLIVNHSGESIKLIQKVERAGLI